MSADKSFKVSKLYKFKARFEFIERVIFMLIPTAQGRVRWLRKQKNALFGEYVHYQPRKYPGEHDRVKIHDNVAIAADVEFTGHDIIRWVFDGVEGHRVCKEFRDCIEIHENCFIGAGVRLLPNVSIGPNAIVAPGAVDNKDVLPGTVMGGVPAKLIGKFEDFQQKRLKWSEGHSVPISCVTMALW